KIDSQKNRLGEEGEALERKRHANDSTRILHKLRPEQPQLERKDRTGHSTDREQNRRPCRPSLTQFKKNGLFCLIRFFVFMTEHYSQRSTSEVKRSEFW